MTYTDAEIDAKFTALEDNYNEALDTIWMLLAGMLVFFMHAGFSLLESGSVREKNSHHILAKNLVVICLGFLCWYVFGWAWAYGALENPNKFTGGTEFVHDGFWDAQSRFRNWFFQGAFCATACTIVSGAMAERTQLRGFTIFSILMTSFIYPIVVYWGWSGSGWLLYEDDAGETVSSVGPAYIDFAGSGLVHMVGGIAALCGSIVVGARKDRWTHSDEDEFNAHNVPFCVLGTLFLWFGWYGFNPGSTLELHTKEKAYQAGMVAVNTTLAPCIAGPLVFLLRRVAEGFLDIGAFCNGILAGLVSITAGCATVKPWESLIIGAIGALLYEGTSMLMRRVKIDDVVDAFAVHGACGFWGILALGFFGDPDTGTGGNGLFYGGDQLGVQLLAGLAITAWVGGLSLMIFLPLKLMGALRASDEHQDVGADALEHSPRKAFEVPNTLEVPKSLEGEDVEI